MRISVITATYNREKELLKLYNSLKKNYESFKDFEWIVMDDGSTDNTKELFNKWIKEVNFKIDYHYNKNMGKQREINEAMQYITGDIVIEIDSDDYLTDNGLEMVSNDYENIDDNVYGILYKRILGNKDTSMLPELNNKVVTLFDIHNKYGYDFDMNLTFKASVRKKYFYKVEDKENFVTEARLYYELDQLYDGLLFKDVNLVYGEYLNEGYSKNINRIFKKYPKGYVKYFNECLTYINKGTKFKRVLYFIKHYILFSYLTGVKKMDCIKKAKRFKGLVALLVIPGYIKSKRF
jgi:glycosyltransferase involved in cell wall biosynthesis